MNSPLTSTHSVLSALRGRLLGGDGVDDKISEGLSLEELWTSYTSSVETKIASEYSLSPERVQQSQLMRLQYSQENGKVNSPSSFAVAMNSSSRPPASILEKFIKAGGTTGRIDSDSMKAAMSPPPPAPSSAADSAMVMSLQAEIAELRARLTRSSSEASQREGALERELETALERAELTISALEEQLEDATEKTKAAKSEAAAALEAAAAADAKASSVPMNRSEDDVIMLSPGTPPIPAGRESAIKILELEKERDELKEQVEELSAQVKSDTSNQRHKDAETAEAVAKSAEAAAQITTLSSEKERLEQENCTLRERVQLVETESLQLEASAAERIAAAEAATEKAAAELGTARSEAHASAAELQRTAETLKLREQELDDARATHEELLKKVEEAGKAAEDSEGLEGEPSPAKRSQMIIALEAQVQELSERLKNKSASLDAASDRLAQLETSSMAEADAAREEIEALKRIVDRKERESKSSELAATAASERADAEVDRLKGKVQMLEEQLRLQDEALEEVKESGGDARSALEAEVATLKEQMKEQERGEKMRIDDAVRAATQESDEKRSEAEEEAASRQTDLLKALSENREMKGRIEELESKCSDAEMAKAEAERLANSKENESELESEIYRLNEETERLRIELDEERSRGDLRLREGDTIVAEVRAQLSKATARAEKAEAECTTAKAQLASMKTEARQATSKVSELEIEMKMHRQEAERAIQRARELSALNGSTQASSSNQGQSNPRPSPTPESSSSSSSDDDDDDEDEDEDEVSIMSEATSTSTGNAKSPETGVAAKFLKFQQEQQAKQQLGDGLDMPMQGARDIQRQQEEEEAQKKRNAEQAREAAKAQAAAAAEAQEVDEMSSEAESSSDDDSSENSEDSEDDENDGKTGWERMTHNGKYYYWNWDTSETTWKRPTDYDSAEDANPDVAKAAASRRKDSVGSAAKHGTPSEGNGERSATSQRQQQVDKREARQREVKAFRKLLSEGIEVKKFSQNSRFRSKPSARVLWLDTRSQTLYWQKGQKNPAKVKSDASLRLSDIVDVSEGIKTPALKKSGSEDKADRYLSLVGRGSAKSLDVEVHSVKMRNDLSKGFKMLIAS